MISSSPERNTFQAEMYIKRCEEKGEEPSEEELALLGQQGGPQIPTGPGGGLPGLEQVLGAIGQGPPPQGVPSG